MSFKVVVFVAAVFAYEANAQLGGVVRPFTTGFANGFSDVAKPINRFGQTVIPPVNDYISGLPQMVPYPGQFVPKPQAAFDRFDSFAPGIPGPSFFQGMRPPPPMRPQNQFFTIQSQYFRPSRPYPVPPVVGETADKYRPSSLLIQTPSEVPKPEGPATLEAQFELPKPERPSTLELPKPEGPATIDGEFDIPTMQRPLQVEENEQ